MEHKVALLGFGGVGQGFLNIVKEKNHHLQHKHGQSINIVSISDVLKGSLHNNDGLSLDKITHSIQIDGTLNHYKDEAGLERGWDAFTMIHKSHRKHRSRDDLHRCGNRPTSHRSL